MDSPAIIYEDDFIIAVDKPAGMLSYPVPASAEKTVGDLVGGLPVHRLDRDTSGILILAKDEKTKSLMQGLFAKRLIKKTYTTLIWGKIEPVEGEIKIPLGRGSKDRLKVVPSSIGRESHTIYRVEKHYPKSDTSLLKINLKTGRTHQIRVHMSAIGHPVVGDQKYSKRKAELKRQFLHASEISFIHPITGKNVKLYSKLPNDLDSFLKKQT